MIWAAWRYREAQKGHLTGRRSRKHIARFMLVALYTGTRSGAICGAAIWPTEGRGYVDLDEGCSIGERQARSKRKSDSLRSAYQTGSSFIFVDGTGSTPRRIRDRVRRKAGRPCDEGVRKGRGRRQGEGCDAACASPHCCDLGDAKCSRPICSCRLFRYDDWRFSNASTATIIQITTRGSATLSRAAQVPHRLGGTNQDITERDGEAQQMQGFQRSPLIRDEGVGGSNPLTPTKFPEKFQELIKTPTR